MTTYLLQAGCWEAAMGRSTAVATAAELMVTQASQAAVKRMAEESAWRLSVDTSRAAAAAVAGELVEEAARIAKELEESCTMADAAEAQADADASTESKGAAAVLFAAERDDAREKNAALEAAWANDALGRRASADLLRPGSSKEGDIIGLQAAVDASMREAEEARWVVGAAQARARATTTARFLLVQQMSNARAVVQSQTQAHTLRAELRSAEAEARTTAASVLIAAEDLIALQKRLGNEALWAQEIAALRFGADVAGQQLLATQAAAAEALASDDACGMGGQSDSSCSLAQPDGTASL